MKYWLRLSFNKYYIDALAFGVSAGRWYFDYHVSILWLGAWGRIGGGRRGQPGSQIGGIMMAQGQQEATDAPK